MIWDGLRDIEALPTVADVIGLLLCGVCAVSLSFLMWAIIP